jgi:hypothetical protein
MGQGGVMPKGQMTGNPTNIVCWLIGGYYDGTVWGIAYDKDNLQDEIEMVHFVNPRAEALGVTILGITKQQGDDKEVVETYKLIYDQDTPPAFAIYVLEGSQFDEAAAEDLDSFVNLFKEFHGYNLPPEQLDPKNMTGETRRVDVG